MKESEFQSKLIKKIKGLFPGCIVMKNDPDYIQGLPDLTILYKDKWATLECKVSEKASRQANQDFYVSRMNEMSYSAFIFPENEIGVLYELQVLFDCPSK
jgi:hypothetical protein